MNAKTSENSPIYVSWLTLPKDVVAAGGRFGITFAPGKHATSKYSEGHWQRDLAKDLDRLVAVEKVSDLVSLLPDDELVDLKIPQLVTEAEARGIHVVRYPITDTGTPPLELAGRIVDDIIVRVRAGKSVVVHCQGGLGRAGCIGGCVLVALGHDGESALAAVRKARGKHAPETDAQKQLVRTFGHAPRPTPTTAVPAPIPAQIVASAAPMAGRASTPTTTLPARPEPTTRTVVLVREPAAQRALRDSFRGAVIGGAIGDALGHPTEFMKMAAIRQKWGPAGVSGFELYWNKDGKRFSPYTDDTQMAEQVLHSLLEARDVDELEIEPLMQIMARRFVQWSTHPQGGHRAPGNACMAGCRALALGTDWSQAGGEKAGGCGSVMRAYPFGLMFHDDVGAAVDFAVAHSAPTHRDPIALAACAAMAVGVARQVHGADVVTTALEMIAVARPYSETTALMMARALGEARDQSVNADDVFERLQSWAAHEAIAAAVYLMVRYPDDAHAAVLHGANTPGDSDSIATLAGALLGARLGLSAFPPSWVEDVERSAELLTLADQLIDGGPPDDLSDAADDEADDDDSA